LDTGTLSRVSASAWYYRHGDSLKLAIALTLVDVRWYSYAMASDEFLDRALHAIADPTRRRILQALRHSENNSATKPCLCAGDIEEQMKLSQPTISHHMSILTKSGLVAATKQGQWRWYSRNEKAIRQVVKTLRGKL